MKGKIPLLLSGMAVSAWSPRKKVINVIPFLSLTAVTHTCTVAPVSDKTITLHLTILISLRWAQDGPKRQIHSEQCESFWGVHGQEMQRRGKHEVYNRTEQENKDVQNRENKKLFRNCFVRRTDGWKQRRQQLSLLPRDGVGGREAVACHSSPRRRCYAHLLGVCSTIGWEQRTWTPCPAASCPPRYSNELSSGRTELQQQSIWISFLCLATAVGVLGLPVMDTCATIIQGSKRWLDYHVTMPDEARKQNAEGCMMLSTDTQFLGGGPRDFVER